MNIVPFTHTHPMHMHPPPFTECTHLHTHNAYTECIHRMHIPLESHLEHVSQCPPRHELQHKIHKCGVFILVHKLNHTSGMLRGKLF